MFVLCIHRITIHDMHLVYRASLAPFGISNVVAQHDLFLFFSFSHLKNPVSLSGASRSKYSFVNGDRRPRSDDGIGVEVESTTH